jgi:mycothiol S-conjugate amidase
MVVSCTGGERGDVLNPSYQKLDAHDMVVLRQKEMADAAEILGVAHTWLGFEDSGYHEGDPADWKLPPGSFGEIDPEPEIEALVKLVRSFRPQVMTTYDEKGGYPHPDHIRCHVISVAAYRAAGDPDAYPDAGEPWEVSKLYYNVGFSLRRMKAINDAVVAAGLESPFEEWLKRSSEGGWPDSYERATTHIPVAGFFEKRDAALRAHATQIDPDAHWFAVPYELETEVWPTEEYELAESRVPTTTPEDDLFAGIRESVAA